jgi:hypothetical protein
VYYDHLTYILDAYKKYIKETGAILDTTANFLKINLDQYEKLQPLYFNIEDRIYEFNANAQIWPRALNGVIGGTKDSIYLIVSELDADLSKDVGFVAGTAFLERFYAVFDSRRHRVCLANTQFTDLTSIN